jgi:hypothetical protein
LCILVSVLSLPFISARTFPRQTELIVNAVILLFVNDVDEQVFNIVKILNGPWLHKVVDEAETYSAQLLERDIGDNGDEEGVKQVDKGAERAAGEDVFGAAQDQIDLSSRSKETSTTCSSKKSGEQRSMWKGKFGSTSVIVDPNSNEDLVRQVELLQKQMDEMQRKMQ